MQHQLDAMERKRDGGKEEMNSEGKFYHGRSFGKKKSAGKNRFKGDKKAFAKSAKK